MSSSRNARTSKDTEEDARNASLKETFKHLADKNGKITKSRLREFIEDLGFDFTDEEIDEMLEVADTDDTGEVSYKGLVGMVREFKEDFPDVKLEKLKQYTRRKNKPSKEELRRELTMLSEVRMTPGPGSSYARRSVMNDGSISLTPLPTSHALGSRNAGRNRVNSRQATSRQAGSRLESNTPSRAENSQNMKHDREHVSQNQNQSPDDIHNRENLAETPEGSRVSRHNTRSNLRAETESRNGVSRNGDVETSESANDVGVPKASVAMITKKAKERARERQDGGEISAENNRNMERQRSNLSQNKRARVARTPSENKNASETGDIATPRPKGPSRQATNISQVSVTSRQSKTSRQAEQPRQATTSRQAASRNATSRQATSRNAMSRQVESRQSAAQNQTTPSRQSNTPHQTTTPRRTPVTSRQKQSDASIVVDMSGVSSVEHNNDKEERDENEENNDDEDDDGDFYDNETTDDKERLARKRTEYTEAEYMGRTQETPDEDGESQDDASGNGEDEEEEDDSGVDDVEAGHDRISRKSFVPENIIDQEVDTAMGVYVEVMPTHQEELDGRDARHNTLQEYNRRHQTQTKKSKPPKTTPRFKHKKPVIHDEYKDSGYYSAIGCAYRLSDIRRRQKVLYLMWQTVWDEAVKKQEHNRKIKNNLRRKKKTVAAK